MSKSRKILRTVAAVAVIAALAGVGAFSVFSDFTENENNQVSAGSVTIADNDGDSAMYSLTNAKPGQVAPAKCIRVDYSGSLPADVRLFTTSTVGALGPNVNVKVEAGTQGTFNSDCTGFSSQQTLFDGPLSTFPTSYGGGLSDYPGSETSWDDGEAVVYRFTATLSSNTPDTLQGESTGLHTFRWEAQNQP